MTKAVATQNIPERIAIIKSAAVQQIRVLTVYQRLAEETEDIILLAIHEVPEGKVNRGGTVSRLATASAEIILLL